MHQAGGAPTNAKRSAAEADALVVSVLQGYADVLLRFARRHSQCDEDAADAYQRAIEIFVRHARRLDPETAHRWLFRVLRHEAAAVREQHVRHLAVVATDPDETGSRHQSSPEERVLERERFEQAAEALTGLKGSELRALWLQANGSSYAEIAAECGWTRTKVNRVIVEGRRRLLAHRAEIESGRECVRAEAVLKAAVAGEATSRQLVDVQPHLRYCPGCRARVRGLRNGPRTGAPVEVAATA